MTAQASALKVRSGQKRKPITDGITHGCYMQIVPTQPGEQIGDLVYIEMGLIITTTITADNGQVIISGSNGMDHLAITLNQPTPTWPGNPDPIREICTVPAQTITTTIEFGEMVYPVSVQAHNRRCDRSVRLPQKLSE